MYDAALAGKVALVTGAARGIGQATAAVLLQRGCMVVLNDIDDKALQDAVSRLGSKTLAVAGDVADVPSVEHLVQQVEASFGRLDFLVNNAAVTTTRQSLDDWDDTTFDRIMRANVRGPLLCTRAARGMLARDGGGAIVNLSSVGATASFRGAVPYTTSKGAVEALTRAMALELASVGVRVNAVAPGMVTTDRWNTVTDAERARRDALIPLGRPATAGEVASVIAFLLSADAVYMTGQVLIVDGGLTVQTYTAADEAAFSPAGPLGEADGPVSRADI